MKTYAIIMAAGLGTRMKSDLPKCAFPLLNKPMIEYIVDSLEKSSVDEIIVVVGHKKEVIENILGDRVKYAYQQEQLGTANAVACALPFVDKGNVIILPGDTPLIDIDIIDKLNNAHIENKNDFTIGTIELDDPTGFGRIIRINNSIKRIVEQKDANNDELKIKEINTGLFCLDSELLKKSVSKVKNDNAKKEYYLTDIVEILSDKKIGSFTIEDKYKLTGINDLFTLSEVETSLRNELNKNHMLNGVNIINPSSVTISKDVVIESGVIINQNTLITGKSIIGKNSVIGCNCELNNVIIGQGVTVTHSVISNSTIKNNSTVGPFAHLRMNSVVGENNRIGNFVEMKNSTTGTKTNSAHLTYIGDTEAGDNVNFGCGTVTVNYDGKVKSKTTIGDRVFIGCNSNLIAPVTIESDSFIAAGTTVTDNVKENDFVIGRCKQINKANYKKHFK